MKRVYTSVKDIDFKISELPKMPMPCKVLMVRPTFYDVEYVINPHMKGQIGAVDKMQAQNEWEHLVDGYRELGLKVDIIDGVKGLPDMVFCANQSLPVIDENGNLSAIMGIMNSPERKPEVEKIEEWYRTQDYNTTHLNSSITESFEGMGDAIWHFKRRLIWGGYGFRTSLKAYEEIAEITGAPVVALELIDENFYHLDTCLCMLKEDTVMVYSDAFTPGGLEMIHKMFKHVIEVSRYEALNLFAVNAVCPDGKNVLIQQGCTDANKKLRDAGFSVHEYSTYEFIKSGGSVFCMKLLYW